MLPSVGTLLNGVFNSNSIRNPLGGYYYTQYRYLKNSWGFFCKFLILNATSFIYSYIFISQEFSVVW